MSNLGFGEVLVIVGLILSMVAFGLWVWAITDAAQTPEPVWRAAGQNKVVWIVVTVVLGMLGAFAYVAIARPMLVRARAEPPATP